MESQDVDILEGDVIEAPPRKPSKTVPIYEIEGEHYQQYKKPDSLEWELSMLWSRHTVSSEAKNWGKIKSRQSKPIDALYQRHKTFDRVPAFKLYHEKDLKGVFERVQRPTKSAMLRSSVKRREDETTPKLENPPPSEGEKVLVARLLRPTSSYERRRQLTLKYRPVPLVAP